MDDQMRGRDGKRSSNGARVQTWLGMVGKTIYLQAALWAEAIRGNCFYEVLPHRRDHHYHDHEQSETIYFVGRLMAILARISTGGIRMFAMCFRTQLDPKPLF